MFAMLSRDGANPDTFSVIDLASAFSRLFLDEESTELLTINTRKGLFKSRRLCFGVKTLTSQFQRVMDSILSGIKGVMVRVDDILVATSGGVTTHVGVIKQVFSRLTKHNVKLNGAKCQFFQAQVKYMGHILSKQGISAVNSKLDAIRLAPRPKDVSQLRSFLGMLNYYSKRIKAFPPNCAHCISFSVTRLSGFGPKNLNLLPYGLKKFFRVSRFWFIMTPKNLSF